MLAVHLQRHRRLVRDRVADHLLVVVERAAEHLVDRVVQRARPPRRRGPTPCWNGDSRAVQRISSTHERPMPAITRWSRSSGCRWRGWSSSVGELLGRRRRAGLRARAWRPPRRLSTASVGQQLRPRALLGAELAQPQLAAVLEPHQEPRGAVAQRRALVEQLQPAGRHQVDRAATGRRTRRRASCRRAARRPAHGRRAPRAAGRTSSSARCPGASADSTRAPATPADRRRAVISTSGSSGTPQD